MSSPPPRQFEPTKQESWDADLPEEKPNITEEDKLPQENESSSRNPGRLDEVEKPPMSRSTSPATKDFDLGVVGRKHGTIYREKQINPHKVYVGGLPEHTREEDLQSCFGKIGQIVSIELKLGFGFVEFADRQSAEESVSKYNEGYFMGNKIRVELSHGGGRSARFTGDASACFKCGQMGHWARECPNHVVALRNRRPENTLMDRVTHPLPRDLPPRGYSPPRGDYRPSRESRYAYHDSQPPPRPPSRDRQDYRPRDYRPTTPPPRDYRDYPVVDRPSRDVDEYRRDPRGSYPSRYDTRGGYYPEADYNSRQNHTSMSDSYDSRPYDSRAFYDRRPVPSDRYPPPSYGRSRTPPRNDFDRFPPPRDYSDYRGRATTPSRYPENGRGINDNARYRRRSSSPGRPALPYGSGSYSAPLYNAEGYSSSGNFPDSYSPSANRSSTRDRDYPLRSGRNSGNLVRRP